MTDTPEPVRRLYHRLLMQRTGEQRLLMGCAMFETARALMRAGLGDPEGTDHSARMRVDLFLRTYGRDFDAQTRDRLAARLLERGDA